MGKTYVVAGSGFRGFCDAVALSAIPGAKVHIVEAAPFFGGLSYSLDINGFAVDKGVHMFDSIPAELGEMITEIMDGQVKTIDFVSASAFNGEVTEGFSLPDLASLDEETKEKIKQEVLERAKEKNPEEGAKTLSDVFYARYGQTAGKIFNDIFEKVYSISAEEIEPSGMAVTSLHRLKFLDDEAMKELKQDPWLDTVLAARRGAMGKIDDLVSIYPTDGEAMRGWCNRSVEWLKAKGVDITLEEKITGLENTDKGVKVVTDKQEIEADYIIWSNDNLDALGQLLGIENKLKELQHGTPMVFVTMMTQADKIKDFTYVQNFEPEGLTYRTASAGLYSDQVREDGVSFITSECPVAIGSPNWEDADGMVPDVWAECKRLGVVEEDAELVDFKAIKIPSTFKAAKTGYSDELSSFMKQVPKKCNRVILRDPTLFFRRSVYLDSLNLREQVELADAAA